MGKTGKYFFVFFPRPRQVYLPHPLTATHGLGKVRSGRGAAYSTGQERGMTMLS